MSSSYQYSSSNRNGTVPPPLPAPLMQANAGSKSNAHPSVSSSLSSSYDFLVKMVIVGDSGVGKSSLMRQFVDHQFPENYLSTIGVDFSIKRMDVEGRTAKVQIWDTAGQERFANIVSTYYRGTHGVMVVVDVTNPHSLASVPKWVEQARSYAPVGCVLTLVANKCDLTQHRCVSHSQLADMADNYGMTLVEVSAKAADNVEKAFATLVHAVADMLADNFRDAAAAKLKVDQVDTSGGSKLDDDRACCVTM